MYEHKRTGQLLPILIGVTMEDPAGSGQEVTVLGVEKDKTTGNMIPLGGTHEDPEGQGLVAIKLGAKAVDVVTGELSPITGVRRDPTSGEVVAVTLSSSSGNKKRKAPIGAQALLEEEVAARRSFWRRQREREAEVTSHEFVLAVKLLFQTDKVSFRHNRWPQLSACFNHLLRTGELLASRRRSAARAGASARLGVSGEARVAATRHRRAGDGDHTTARHPRRPH